MSPTGADPEIVWESCADTDCPAPTVADNRHCVSHLDGGSLQAWFTHLGETGDLDLRGASLSHGLLQQVIQAAPLDPDGRRRLRSARFDEATFEGDAVFDGFVFAGEASFVKTSFRGHARFGSVRFDGAARFAGATFATHAWFMGTIFGDDASFAGASFEGPAWFGEVMFNGFADFGGSAFGSDLLAPDAKFRGDASFVEAKFSRKVRFDEDAFAQAVAFDDAVFDKPAEMPPSVKADVKRRAAEATPESAPGEEDLPPPPPRLTAPPRRRRSLRSLLPWVGLGILVLGAGFYVTRDEGTKADFVPFARGDESAFRFLLKDGVTGRPVRYNPCQVLRYVVNPELGPADWRSVVQEAATEVTRATGIKLQFEGVTDEVVRADLNAAPTGKRDLEDPVAFASFYKGVFNRPSFQPERYGADRWAPILIGWAVLGDTPPDEAVEVLGVGASDPRVVAPLVDSNGTQPGFVAYVSGQAVINTNVPRRYLKTALMHELGHALGLAHIQDNVAIMRPNTRAGIPAWSAGDLSGLRKVGRPAGCLPAVPPGP